MKYLAPIVLFVYNRPDHTLKALEALANNPLAKESTLYIYADGARHGASNDTLQAIAQTRAILRQKKWCKEVQIIESDVNKGLANSIQQGVTDIIDKHGKIIVLEDDIVTSKGFLKYMNDALDIYENEEKVMHISSFLPLTDESYKLPETFFLHFMSCWGWATWKRAWDTLILDTQKLHDEVANHPNFELFDYKNHTMFLQIEENLNGNMKTWAIKWFSTIFLNQGLCLYPRQSLTRNIGLDGTGENCEDALSEELNTVLADFILVKKLNNIEELQVGREYLENFYRFGKTVTWKNRFSLKFPRVYYFLYNLK